MRCLVLVALLSGCSTPYWYASGRPFIVPEHTVSVDRPCAMHIMGCANLQGRTIELDRRLTEAERACIYTHEYRHFLGDDHATDRTHYAWDCGNGTIYALTNERANILGRMAR